MPAQKLGFIGLGSMGTPIARRLLAAAGGLKVFDLRSEAMEALVAEGAVPAEGPGDVAASCEVIFTCLPGPPQLQEVYMGSGGSEKGIAEQLRPGALCVDFTTGDGETLRRVEEAVVQKGAAFLASPVTNGVRNAETGSLTLFLAGSAEAREAATPWLEHAAVKMHYLGPDVTRAAAAKLVTNLLWFVHAAAVGEAVCLALKCGIPRESVESILTDSVADSWVARNDLPSIRAGHYDPSFSLALCCKDLRLVRELAEARGVPLPLGERAAERFQMAAEAFGLDGAELLVARLIESEAGVFFSEADNSGNDLE